MVAFAVVVVTGFFGAIAGFAGANEGDLEPRFEITNVQTNGPVTEGETYEVILTVKHNRNETNSTRLDFYVDGDRKGGSLDSFGPGQEKTIETGWTPYDGDAGQHTAKVELKHQYKPITYETKTWEFTVEEPHPEVSISGTNSPVVEGETLTVPATIKNTNNTPITQSVALNVGGEERDSTTVTLDPDESTTVDFEWATESGDVGDYTATVATTGGSATTSVSVIQPPEFDVSIDSTNMPVEGDTLTVSTTVESVAPVADTQTVELEVGGVVRDTTEVTLASDASTTRDLSWDTSDGDAGIYTAVVRSETDADTNAVTIVDAPNFAVAIDSINDPIEVGDPLVLARARDLEPVERTDATAEDATTGDAATEDTTAEGGADAGTADDDEEDR